MLMYQVDDRYWSEVLCSTIMTHPGSPLGQGHRLKNFVFKFLALAFISLYLLNMLMDQVDTVHVDRYWSLVSCCTIMTHLDDFQVKVMDLEILC